MSSTDSEGVVSKDGMHGTIVRSAQLSRGGEPVVAVRFDNGRELLVPTDLLLEQPDGSFKLMVGVDELERRNTAQAANPDGTITVPVVEERLNADTREVTTGRVRVRTEVHEREETADEPLMRQTLDVERVPRNQVLDSPAEVRREGTTLIIPVMEEVLVVEKRLLLKEELHVTMHEQTVHEPQQVTLRSQEVVVERTNEPEGDARQR